MMRSIVLERKRILTVVLTTTATTVVRVNQPELDAFEIIFVNDRKHFKSPRITRDNCIRFYFFAEDWKHLKSFIKRARTIITFFSVSLLVISIIYIIVILLATLKVCKSKPTHKISSQSCKSFFFFFQFSQLRLRVCYI